ncbi:hypothetical protein [Nitrosovibrio sp. Nv6]|uniref:hypothetical protein n=1 Tax=Nitrosovibrio sp. Nv6 TaxID=1855340 RepID=UPI0008CF2817|nr:hypothetical protein [Nitrosovibrio sp. Nv6]SEP38766.1 hypothetical protein SAMN05216316_2731 [Nitrosovibrio sp. Nv6]
MSAEMIRTNENAPAATEADFKAKLNRNYKRLPPYGKQLMAIREAGKVPVRKVIVSFDWNLGRAYPRIIIPADANPAELDFRFLAGLPVQIIYGSQEAHRVDALVQEILLANPSLLVTFALDLIGTAPVVTLIKPPQSADVGGDK